MMVVEIMRMISNSIVKQNIILRNTGDQPAKDEYLVDYASL